MIFRSSELIFFLSILISIINAATIGIDTDGSQTQSTTADASTHTSTNDVNASDDWVSVEFHDTGIDEINWHDHLQFYWNTPILTASSDPELHPFLQENIFPNLHEILKILPQTDNRFGDLFNVSDVINLIDDLLIEMNDATDDNTDNNNTSNIYNSFRELIRMYSLRIVSWMGLYTRGQCIIDADLNSLYLLILSPGEIIPLHSPYNFAVNNIEHESHDLISILSIQPESFYNKHNQNNDGIFIYDPRGTVSGYGFANVFIQTSQSEQLNTRGGYLHIFPSGIKFNTLPVDYTRVFLVSFSKLYSVHQPYRKQMQSQNQVYNNENLPIYHFQSSLSSYVSSNDEPFFDQNIMFFSSFGTPIYQSFINKFASLSIPYNNITFNTFKTLSSCFLSYSSRSSSVFKSNRGGWQSKANIFNIYKDISWIVSGNDHLIENDKCIKSIKLLYNYIIEQISLWLLSFSNSYYFDNNGLMINLETLNNDDINIYIDIIDSWFNVNKQISMNVPHIHPNSDLSGVVYINVPFYKSKNKLKYSFDGDIYFDDPRTNLFDNNMNLPFAQFNEPVQIKPKIGQILLFPSWLRHWTMPTYSNQPRISFAFNVKFKGIKKSETNLNNKKQKESDEDSFIIYKRDL